jgi:transposase
MPKSKSPYPDAFRAEAIELVRASGKPIATVARDLGVSGETLRLWVRQADRCRARPAGRTDERGAGGARAAAPRGEDAPTGAGHLEKAAASFAKETL